MQVVILAGGRGTRISEYTKKIPKPMVNIGNKPIIEHIMNYYSSFGYDDFFIALGYKGKIIEDYFKKNNRNYKITFIKTGLNSMTGFRLNKVMSYLKKEDFLLTYGDGLSNVNLRNLIRHHKKNKKIITVTAVRPPARFGYLKLKNSTVVSFEEKNQINEGWINGGYFVVNYKFINFLNENTNLILEKKPLTLAAKKNQFNAYKHNGYWACMDTLRDKENLENLLKQKKAPWII